jgi:hypothetical protein
MLLLKKLNEQGPKLTQKTSFYFHCYKGVENFNLVPKVLFYLYLILMF